MTDRYGKVKKQIDLGSNSISDINEIIKLSDFYDIIKLIGLEAERKDKFGKWHIVELNKEIILTVK